MEILSRCEDILALVEKYHQNHQNEAGISAQEISDILASDRANISRYLNQLCQQGKLEKNDGRPVRYRLKSASKIFPKGKDSLSAIIGAGSSLQVAVQQAKAAILYPPRGLHTLILGETGVGKSMFAEAMYDFACSSGMISLEAPFVRFNCADYADNPQLLVGQIFGVKKGAYSGADNDKHGLLKQADGGIFFLDEVHRLPPQGQEMLFTFIDKGFFRPLGDTSSMQSATVQIIAATTEEPRSALLGTFTRRIPMTISLPPLRQRTIDERFALVKYFLCLEAKRLQHEIYVEHNAILSFLLYECPNNIGQLRSDIQLACAQAFLAHQSEAQSYILVHQENLQNRVKRGILRLSEQRQEVQCFLDKNEDIMIFSPDGDDNDKENNDAVTMPDFYGCIAKRVDKLRAQGMAEAEVRAVVNVDIEQHFQRYLSDLPERFRRDELIKVVPEKIIDLVEDILVAAEADLKREFDEKVYYGLSLHLSKSIERIRYGSPIYYPQLNRVRKRHAMEFQEAMKIAHTIEEKLNIEVPLDEIGYITMFLIPPDERPDEISKNQVQILVLMHGPAIASGMAEVANTFAGTEVAHSLDMPLSMKVADIYQEVLALLRQLPLERGVLLLVDMGSLCNFANMLQEDLGANIRCIDMTSTPIVIEACRKSVEGCDLEEIYRDCREVGRYRLQSVRGTNERPFMIVTTCFTGAGAALYLKEYLENNLTGKKIKITALNILDRSDFYCRLQTLSQTYRIVAVVGTVEFPVEKVPFFSAADILAADGIKKLQQVIQETSDYERIRGSLQAHLAGIDVGRALDGALLFLRLIKRRLHLQLAPDVGTGIAIHILFMIDRIINKKAGRKFPQCSEYQAEHVSAFTFAREAMHTLEKTNNIKIPLEELAFVVKMCLENDQNAQNSRQKRTV